MKIVWISSSPFAHNGFGTQAHVACRGLALRGHEVTLIAMHRPQEAASWVWELPDGDVLQAEPRTDLASLGAKRLYKILPHGVENMFGGKMVELLLRQTKPDVFCTLHDTQNVNFMAQIPNGTGIPWFHWLPWDNSIWEPDITRYFMESQCQVVLMSDFTEALCRNARFPYVGKIYHGVNTKVYRPQSNKKEVRNKLWSDGKLENKWVFGYIGQNEERKHNDILIRAFAKFQKDKPDVRLFMHTDIEEPYPAHWSYKILNLIEKLDVDEKFAATPRIHFISKFPDKTMADIYAAQDVIGSSTSGEGFGLMALYGNACGIPSIVTDINTTDQLLLGGKAGWKVPVAALYEAPGGYTRGIINEDVMAGMMEDAYKNPDKIRQFGEVGRADVLAKYDQDLIGNQWADLLESKVKR